MTISTVPTIYPLILFAPSIGSIISQISFDIRDFIPGGIKPNLSMLSPGFLVGSAGTIRVNETPDDALGVNGDWIVLSDASAVYEKVDGHYVGVSLTPTITFAYQGWRAIGTVVGGRWVVSFNPSLHIAGHTPCEIQASSTGDISY